MSRAVGPVRRRAQAVDRADPGHDEAAHRLEENLGAVNVEFTPEDLREIEEAASEIDVQGARNPEKIEAMTGREVVGAR